MMKTFKTTFNIGISQKALSKGFVVPLKINFKNTPHIILVAPSGTSLSRRFLQIF